MLGTGRAAAAPGGAGAEDDWAAADQPREVEGAAAEMDEEEVGPAPREVQGPTPPLLCCGA